MIDGLLTEPVWQEAPPLTDTEALNGLGPINRAFIVKYVRQFDILN